MVCRICFWIILRKDTVVCRNIERPADMVKVFNAWGTAAAFQIFLKRYRVVQKLRTGCLRQMQPLSGFFQCIAENPGILDRQGRVLPHLSNVKMAIPCSKYMLWNYYKALSVLMNKKNVVHLDVIWVLFVTMRKGTWSLGNSFKPDNGVGNLLKKYILL